MKRIDIVMAQSKNESRDSLISGYCPHDFIEGIDIRDCSKIRCVTCWNKDDGETERQGGSFDIRSQLAESIVDDFGDNIKFAVPPSGENINEIVNGIDELKREVLGLLRNLHEELSSRRDIGDYVANGYISHRLSTLNDAEYGIKKIFEKY